MKQIPISTLTLNNSTFLGKGGEAEVYKLDQKTVAKIFKDRNHPDWMSDPEREAAANKLVEYQNKLKMFPSGLPINVITPIDLILKYNKIVGYTMRFLDKGEVLKKYSEKTFREKLGKDNNVVAELFTELRDTVAATHSRGVVIGDFNDLNIIVVDDNRLKNKVYVIDSDSFQFGPFLTKVFTTRFVDPRHCDKKNAQVNLIEPHDTNSDWYAFNVMLFQSLLYLHPYGGIYQPTNPAARIAHEIRPLYGISVFNAHVKYPKAALSLKLLHDDVLGYFERVFEKEHREEFPASLFQKMRWTTCTNCGAAHCRAICPECQTTSPVVVQTVQIRGTVKSTTIFRAKDRSGIMRRVMYASESAGHLAYLLWDGTQFVRETGHTINQVPLLPGLKFRIQGQKTLIGLDTQFLVFQGNDHERVGCDTFYKTPMFDCNSTDVFYISNGVIYRHADIPEPLGEGIAGHTAIWVGEDFGFGFYLAASYSQTFTFGLKKKSFNDSCKIRIEGKLIDSNVYFGKDRAWVFISAQIRSNTVNRCWVIDKTGAILAQEEVNQSEDSWLSSIKGKMAIGNIMFSASDRGITRIEVVNGRVMPVKEFPDTEPFVLDNSYLFPEKSGIYVVDSLEIKKLEIG